MPNPHAPTRTLSRRRFLAGVAGAAGAGALAAAAPGIGSGLALASPPAAGGLPSIGELTGWEERLVGYGTRYTGSAGQAAFVDWLGGQFERVPGMRLETDRLTFNRWLAKDWSLSVEQPSSTGRSGRVPLTYYYPYSGWTGPGGVTADLVDLGTYEPAVPGTSGTGDGAAFWAPAKGAIALVKSLPSTFPLSSGQTPTGGYEPGRSSEQAAADYEEYIALLTNPAWQGIFTPISLLDAKDAGVLGVVCAWSGMPDDEVVNQYNPFTTPYPSTTGLATPGDRGCPAVWVGESTGAELATAAASGQSRATLVLTAEVTVGAATDTIYGVLPGTSSSGENMVVNTHTDGPNATEENGGLGLLALARHFASVPSRKRDLWFVMVTGHFQLPQFTKTVPGARPEVGSDATSVWMVDHPDIYQAAVAGITVEHLGCTMWNADPVTGEYRATGGYEWGATYTCQRETTVNATNAEQQAYLAAVDKVNAAGGLDTPVATVLPGALPLYLGEGAPLYAGGLGTVSLIPLPTYLLQAGDAQHPERLDLDKLDMRLAYGQLLSFVDTISTLDATPAALL